MTDHTITISNSVGVFGMARTTEWNNFNWDEALWGEGTNGLVTKACKLISNSLVSTSAVSKKISKLVTNSLPVSSDPSNQTKRTGNGYKYVFRKPSTNADDRALTQWTEV